MQNQARKNEKERMMQTKLKTIFLILTLIPLIAAAEDKQGENECGRLNIQIGNATKKPCRLSVYKVKHGKMLLAPPAVILPGYTERFDLKQTYHGPDIQLSYQCDKSAILFNSQQNYCLLKAGQIHAVVISKTPDIRARVTSERGSYYWGKPGLVSWIFENN